jgi:nitroreductase
MAQQIEEVLDLVDIATLIKQRYSCRSYDRQPIETEKRQRLQLFLDGLQTGPLGSSTRFILASASEQERQSIKGLGTYGFIKGATGFIVGAVKNNPHSLEDYGYQMEHAILAATRMGLGTCWLGGSFTQSSFARKIDKQSDEIVPAVTATGYPAEDARSNVIRRSVNADRRLPWEDLFYNEQFGQSLTPEEAGEFAIPLEMVRFAPSASNKQPWRIVKRRDFWHFYLQRTPNYGKGSLTYGLLRLADLQRVDLGIAMCHFALTAEEFGLPGRWLVGDPGILLSDHLTEYTVSWKSDVN